MKRFGLSVLALGFAALLTVSYANNDAAGQPFEAVGDAEAASVIGGVCFGAANWTCESFGSCFALTCLQNAATVDEPVAQANQSTLVEVFCGAASCGSVLITQNCTN